MKQDQIEPVTAVEETALTKIVTDSGLQLNEAEAIKQSYLPYFVEMAEIKELAKKINFDNPTELDEKIARELRLRTVKIRTGSETVKDERKRLHTLKANVEQSAWNLIKTTCQLDEEIFSKVEKARQIAEQKRKDELKAARTELLNPVCDNASIYPLGEMTEDSFNDLLEGLKLAAQAKAEREAKELTDRLEREKKERIFNERKIELAPYKNFHEPADGELTIDTTQSEYEQFFKNYMDRKTIYEANQEKIRIENERLRKEAEEKEKQLQAEREAAEKERAKQAALRKAEQDRADAVLEEQRKQAAKAKADADEKLRIEKEKADKALADQAKSASEAAAKLKAEQDATLEKERKETARLQAELKAKSDAEAKLKADAELAEKNRISAEQKAALAPDKDRLKKMINESTLTVSSSEFKTTQAEKMETLIINKFNAFRQWALTQIETL